MRRLQRLWGSVSVLTAAVLAGICFLRGNTQRIFFMGVFALWIAYSFAVFLMPVIKRYKYRRNLRKIRKKPQNHSGSNGAELQRLYYLLLCNANHRITGYIKSIYPEVVWKWETAAPEKVITEGETGRIRLFNVDDYNFADISFDNSANIECTFLKAVSNSEVGLGAVNIQPLVYRLVCENGMVINDAVNRKTHLGPTISDNEIFYYSKETVETDDKAFLLKIKDINRALNDTYVIIETLL